MYNSFIILFFGKLYVMVINLRNDILYDIVFVVMKEISRLFIGIKV